MKKTALITGASGGLGLEFAKLCAADGYDLVIVARSEGKLFSIKNELEGRHPITVHVCAADLSKLDAALDVIDFTLEHDIQIDILINNAGFGSFGRFIDLEWQSQYEMAQVNMVAVMQLTHFFLKQMDLRGSGKIMNISSAASLGAGPNMSIYYASKAFVRSFSEAMAEEVRGSGVTITAFCPGPTATGFEKAAKASNTAMFKGAADAAQTAKIGYQTMKKGKVLCFYNWYAKLMNIGSHIMPRAIARKYAAYKNRI